MIPIYCGVDGEENAGLCSGTENCLAVNSQASEANQQATLDFSRAGAEMLANGNYACTWAFTFTPNVDSFRATLVTALAAYSAAPSDATWAEVQKAFVDGWAYEYGVEGN